MKKIYILIIFTILANATFAQAEIWKFNGKKIETDTFVTDTSQYIAYLSPKGKLKFISKEEVYATKLTIKKPYSLSVDTTKGTYILTENSETTTIIQVFYKKDTLDDSFTQEQMHAYMQGMHDGYNRSSTATLVGGAIVGVGAPFLFSVIGVSGTLAPVLPAIYVTATGIPKVSDNKIHVPQDCKHPEHYKVGYKTSSKKKRITNTIISSATGLVVGITAAFLIFEEY